MPDSFAHRLLVGCVGFGETPNEFRSLVFVLVVGGCRAMSVFGVVVVGLCAWLVRSQR